MVVIREGCDFRRVIIVGLFVDVDNVIFMFGGSLIILCLSIFFSYKSSISASIFSSILSMLSLVAF